MNRLFRSSSSVSSRSPMTSIPSLPDIINQEEHSYENISQDLGNWNIPSIDPKQIYQSTFTDNFKTNYNVKTVEKIYAINKEHENCSLLTNEIIKKYTRKGNHFIHIGLIQVAVKPLSVKGINSSILLCLRDARYLNYVPSILGIMESSLHNGPVHFNCFPDFTLSLNDPHILKALTLNIKTAGEITHMIEGSQPLALIYRIYYKTMKTNLNIHALNKCPKDKTVLIQSSTSDANIQVPKTILWKDINLPSQWVLDNEIPQTPITNNIMNLDNIKQYLDGTVRISFDNPGNRKPFLLEEMTNHSVISSRKDSDLLSKTVINDRKLKGIINEGQTSHPFYNQSNNQSEDENENEQTSPTQSDFEPKTINHQLRVINKENKINWKFLTEDFNSKENKLKRHQFRENHDNQEREKIVNKWKKFLSKEKINITFYKWYEKYYGKCNVITKTQWIKEDKSKVSSSHPPIETIIIPVKDSLVIASPFKIANGENDEKKLIEQNNFTNQYLASLGKQLDKIEDKIKDPDIKQYSNIVKEPDQDCEEKPLINLPSKRTNLSLPDKDKTLIKTLDKLFKKLEVPETSKPKTIGVLGFYESPNDSDSSTINEIENQFKKLSFNKPNPTSQTKNWYSRPTPPDLQFEERNLDNQFSVSAKKMYEWNIDGLSEQEILNKLNHMSMVANSYITTFENLNQSEIVEILANGFTGTLRSWWEKHLTEDTRNSIINAYQLDTDGQPIFDESIGFPSDGVNTLIYTIIKHFIGTPSNITERIHDQLSNLTCPTLSDFRWYKDVFLSRVMMREDSNKPFWKEKFVNGLPNLFAHKIREELSKNSGFISYDELTYGEIISIIQKIGLKMCIDHKIAKQINKDKDKAKYELGTFCEQFGLPPIAPSRKKPKHKKFNKYIKKDNKEEFYKKPQKFKKKTFNKKFAKKFDKSKVICHNCGKSGHYKNECRVKDKLNQLHISSEDTELILQLMRIENESSDNNENYSDIPSQTTTNNTDTDSNEPNITIGCADNCNNNCCAKTINVLSKNQEEETSLLIELISKITDSQLKTQYIAKLKTLLTSDNKIKTSKDKEKPKFSLNKTLERFKNPVKEITLIDLNQEVNTLKKEISNLKQEIPKLKEEIDQIKNNSQLLVHDSSGEEEEELKESDEESKIIKQQGLSLKMLKDITIQKWYTNIKLVINKSFTIETSALIDTGADLNCIQEGLIPTTFYEKTNERLSSANGSQMNIKYKLPNVHICQDNICFKTSFVLITNMTDKIILGLPFIYLLYPFTTSTKGLVSKHLGQIVTFNFILEPEEKDLKTIQEQSVTKTLSILNNKKNHLRHLKNEIKYKRIEEQLTDDKLQNKIKQFNNRLLKEICSDVPHAFWHRKKHIVNLPYAKEFKEHLIPTKSRPIQMNHEQLEYCKKEINELLSKGLIRNSKSPWSCAAFYVNKNAEKERGAPRLVINYKPLNKVLEWIRYPLPNKKDLINRLNQAVIFSKFDLKSGFWQIQISNEDRYKTAFTTPFGHYEWNVVPFGLKNGPSEFQNIMNNIFNPFSHFTIVYIDDVLIYSNSIEEHWKHLNSFFNTVKTNGLVLSPSKCSLFQTRVRFLGHTIQYGKIKPIDRAIEFANKFPDEILDKTQLQRFLGSLNYIGEFYKDLRKQCKPLFERLQSNPPPWTSIHTSIVQDIKKYVKTLPCLGIANPSAFKIVETDASEVGFGGILKQKINPSSREEIVCFHSGAWDTTQQNYSTIKKEILSLVLCINKFQHELLNQKFLVRIDCQSAKYILEKDVQNIASKQIFARWQALLSIFDFDIQYIKGSENSIPDFLTREFLQTGIHNEC